MLLMIAPSRHELVLHWRGIVLFSTTARFTDKDFDRFCNGVSRQAHVWRIECGFQSGDSRLLAKFDRAFHRPLDRVESGYIGSDWAYSSGLRGRTA